MRKSLILNTFPEVFVRAFHSLFSRFVGFSLLLSCGFSAQGALSHTRKEQTVSVPVVFEENRGQFDTHTRFLVRNADGAVHFTQTGPEFLLGLAQSQVRIQLQPEKTSNRTELLAEEVMPGKVNYFLGEGASARFQGVPTYGKLRYRNFTPGVDLTFYGTQHSLEHDFVVAPGVSPASVRFQMRGADSVRLNPAGELEIRTTTSQMLFRRPVGYQVIDGKRTAVETHFVLDNSGTISFLVGEYDTTSELVIDPILVFSTYLDGTHSDVPESVATDSSGNIYVAGHTTSPDFPVSNAYQSACGLCTEGGFGESGYLAKLDPTGTTLLYSTYFVGNGQTDIDRIKVDSHGNIIGVGYTASTNFPRVGNYTGNYTSGLFVFSLDPNGTVLNHSEIVGAAGVRQDPGPFYLNPSGLVVDDNSNIYVAGTVFAYSYLPFNFPVTAGTYGSGKPILTSSAVIFVTKLASDGSLIYSTIVPPTSANSSSPLMGGLATDSGGNVYISGTVGPGLATTLNSISPAFPNGAPVNVAYSGQAGFVMKLDPTASQLLFSTYLPGTDNANTLAIAADGSLYVAGTTSETSLPVSANAFQPALKQGAGCTCDGGYVMRLDATGTQVLNATYLSGTIDYNNTLTEYGSSAFDSKGNVYLGGITFSSDFPMTNPVVSYLDMTGNTWAGGTVLAGLSPDLSKLVFSSYFNGDGAGDRLVDMTISSNDHLLLTGGTFSDTNFLTTANTFQPNAPARINSGIGYQHEFVASIDLTTPAPAVCLSSRSVNFGSVNAGSTGTASLTLTNCGNAPLNISSMIPTSGLVSATPLYSNLAAGQSYPIQVKYSPVDSAALSGSVTVTSNATVPTERFFVSGQGVAPKLSVSSSATLPQMVLGTAPATSITLVVQNTGNAPLAISGASISGEFTQTNSCVRTLAVNGFCTVTVTLSPASTGTKQGALTLVSNDPTNPQTTVALTGTVLSSFPAPLLNSMSEQTQITGATNATLTLTGSNFFPQSLVRVNGKTTKPSFINGTSLRITFDPATIATIGEIPITVFNPSPGGGESAPLTLTLYQSVANAGAVMTYVPATNMVYVASNSGSTTRPNTVVSVDPMTGKIGTPISVGKDPSLLTASTDGSYLFVANRTDYTVQRIALATGAVDRTFSYPPNVFCPTCSLLSVKSMQAVPGSPTSFMVAQDSYLSLYNDSGLVNELSTPTYGSLATDYVAFSGTPTHLYSYPFSSTDNFFKQFSVDATGVHAITTPGTASKVTNEVDFSIVAAGTQIYTSSGNVWDSTNKQLLGTIPLSIYNLTSNPYAVGIAVEPNGARVYYGCDQAAGVTITAYDAKTLAAQASLSFADTSMLYTTNLSRWGTDGFAFLSGTSLILFRSSALAGTNLLAPSVTFEVPDHIIGDAPFAVNATSNSPGEIVYTVLSGPATISGNTVTITGVGKVVLQAIQGASGAYGEAEVNATFNVVDSVPTLSFSVPDHTYGDNPVILSASSPSTGALTYSVLSGSATVTGNLLTITGAGQVKVQVSQEASGNYAAKTQVATFQVAPAVLTIKASDLTRVYGVTNPSFVGTISGVINGDSFAESFATTATPSSPVGNYSVVPSVTGSSIANYAVMAVNGSLSITPAGASVSLSAGNGTVASGQNTTLSISVTSMTSGIPTGTAMLWDNGASLGTINLSNGSATYTAILASGFTHHLSAKYSGDTNFTAAATSNDVAVVVTGADTAIATTTAAQQVTPGSAAIYSLQLTPGTGSYPGPVTFSVRGLPNGFTSSFSPSTVTVGATVQTVQMTLQAPVTKAHAGSLGLPHQRRSLNHASLALGFVMLPLIGSLRLRRPFKHWTAFLGALCLATVALVGIVGCASSPQGSTQSPAQNQPQSYAIMVTALSGTIQHQTTVTLMW
jgi:hypothetical protein